MILLCKSFSLILIELCSSSSIVINFKLLNSKLLYHDMQWISLLGNGVICWIFATPYSIPDERQKKDSALDILNKGLTLRRIKPEEYEKKKK